MIITDEKKSRVKQYLEENIQAGLNCSESVFNAFIRADIIGLPMEATALASGVNGGVAGTGHTCGAVAGAVMALGAVYGRPDPIGNHVKMLKDPGKKNEVKDPKDDYRYYMMRRFNNVVGDFKKEMGTTQCQDIIDRNGGYWNENRQAECVHCMRCAVDTALKYLEMEQEEADRLPYAENIFGWE